MSQYIRCPVCKKTVACFIPRGGDGSGVRPRKHVSALDGCTNPCKGYYMVVDVSEVLREEDMSERRSPYRVLKAAQEQEANDAMAWHLTQLNAPAFQREYFFAKPERQWPADFAWPEHRLIVEIDGGLWINGGHSRGRGRLRDMERDNWCVMHEWKVLRFSAEDARNGNAALIVVDYLRKLDQRDLW